MNKCQLKPTAEAREQWDVLLLHITGHKTALNTNRHDSVRGVSEQQEPRAYHLQVCKLCLLAQPKLDHMGTERHHLEFLLQESEPADLRKFPCDKDHVHNQHSPLGLCRSCTAGSAFSPAAKENPAA